MIYIVGIVITFFLVFILLTKQKKSNADWILFTWLCVILSELLLFSLISSNEYVRFPYLLGLEIPLPLLHGPFLFLYTKALTGKPIPFPKTYLHLIPFALAFLSITPFLSLGPEEKAQVYQSEGEEYSILSGIIFSGIIFSGITYTSLVIRTLRQHKNEIKKNFSYIEKINLEWLYRLVIGLSCIWMLVFLADDEIIFVAVVVFVIFIGYYGIKQVGIFTNHPPISNLSLSLDSSETTDLTVSPVENLKYEKTFLSDDLCLEIHGRLVLLMKEQQLYLTPELNLALLSAELNLHPNTLSQVINRIEQKNFFDYINLLRVEEFKERIANPDNQKYTLLSIAYECGFNSKTSFNRNFKNITGLSPSEYYKKVKSGLS